MIRDYEGSVYAELLIFHTYAGLTRHPDNTWSGPASFSSPLSSWILRVTVARNPRSTITDSQCHCTLLCSFNRNFSQIFSSEKWRSLRSCFGSLLDTHKQSPFLSDVSLVLYFYCICTSAQLFVWCLNCLIFFRFSCHPFFISLSDIVMLCCCQHSRLQALC